MTASSARIISLSGRPEDIFSRLSKYRREYITVDLADLSVDLRVQQPLREGKVTKMLRKGYDPALVGTPEISVRAPGAQQCRVKGGESVVLDGQTRCEAARRSGARTMEVKAWYGLTLAEEAWLFTYLNEKSNPTAMSTFKTRITALEPIPLGISDVLKQYGWRVTDAKGADGNFAAVATAEKIYGSTGVFKSPQPGAQVFAKTIKTVTDAWGLNKDGTHNFVIGGIALFLIRYWDQVDQKKLTAALAKITPERLCAQTRAGMKMMATTPVLAAGWQVHAEYNKKCRGATKLGAFAV